MTKVIIIEDKDEKPLLAFRNITLNQGMYEIKKGDIKIKLTKKNINFLSFWLKIKIMYLHENKY